MNLTNILIKRNVSTYDISLGSSMLTNVCCLFYIQHQNKQITELVKNNNSLVDSINKLNTDISKIGEKISIMHSKSLPIIINTSESGLFNKPLFVFGALTVSLGVTYFLSTTILTKVSSLTFTKMFALPKMFTLPKMVSIGSILAKLPLFEQTKLMTVFMKDISTTLFIRILDDQIKGIQFRHIDEEHFTPIIKALEVFIKSRKDQIEVQTQTHDIDEIVANKATETVAVTPDVETITDNPVIETLVINPVAETVAETVSHLSGLF